MTHLMKHRELCDSLAQACAAAGKRAYVELRPAAWRTRPTGVPDVLAMSRYSYGPTTWSLIAYEVKVSRADFQRDVKAGKWMRYVSELGVQRVMFAAPKGLILPDDVPPEAGLIVFDAGKATWRVARTGRVLQNDISKVNQDLLLAMLDNTEQSRLADLKRRLQLHRVAASVESVVGKIHDEDLRPFAHTIGHEFASRVSDKRQAEQEVRNINEWAEQLLTAIAQFRGIDPDALRAEVVRGFGEATLAALEQAGRAAQRFEELHKVAALLEALTSVRYENGRRVESARKAVASVNPKMIA